LYQFQACVYNFAFMEALITFVKVANYIEIKLMGKECRLRIDVTSLAFNVIHANDNISDKTNEVHKCSLS
jgi:hypothetical protein